jgi:hypothetical protein
MIFVLLIVIISSVKLLPISFLFILLFSSNKDKYKYLVGGFLIFTLYLLTNYIIEPFYSYEYIKNFTSNAIEEGGISNASSLEFIKSILELIAIKSKIFSVIFYLFFISFISIITYKFLTKNKFYEKQSNKILSILFIVLSISIILPRFKDYSYITIILPVFYIIILNKKKDVFIFLLFICTLSSKNVSIPIYSQILNLIWDYFSFIIALISWVMYVKEIKLINNRTHINNK